MNWGSAGNFFHMGGYSLYVWGAYGVTAVLMLAEPLLAAGRRRRALRAVDPARPMERHRAAEPMETHTA